MNTCEGCGESYELYQECGCAECEKCGDVHGEFDIFECEDTGRLLCERCINFYR